MGKMLVTGSTGRVGRATMDLLADQGVPVRAVSRRPDRIPALDGVERAFFDYLEPTSYDAVLEDVDGLFVMAPPGATAALDAIGPFLEVAFGAVKKVVVMTMIGVETDPRNPLRRIEGLVERSGVPFVVLRPNWFMDNFHSLWMPGIRQGVIAAPAADAKTAFIDTRDVGACAVTALTTDSFDGRAFTLSGVESLTYAEVAALLSRGIGREVRYQPVDEAAFRTKLLEMGVSQSLAKVLLAMFTAVRAGRCADPNDAVEEILGRPARGFADYLADNAGAWRPRAG